jgi:hypothetical protein
MNEGIRGKRRRKVDGRVVFKVLGMASLGKGKKNV